jgi:drug/metabolite transporter (DMT)-like permease
LTGAGPLAVSAARLVIAALALGVLALFRRDTAQPVAGRERLILAAAGVALAIHFASWIASLDYTSVAVSTLLVSTSPIWTAAYDAIVHRKFFSTVSALAFVAGGIGLYMVVGFDRTAAPHAGLEWLGNALALTGAAAIAAYLILVRTVRDALGTRTIVTHTYGWAAAILVIAAALAHQAPPALTNVTAWGGIVAMALISQLLGHTAMNAALRWFSPSAISFSTLLEPVIAAVLAFAIFHEAIPPIALLGAAILLASVCVFIWRAPD